VDVDAGYGTVEVRQRPEARVIMFLSGTRFDPEADLAAMPATDLEDLVNDVRRNDLVLLENLPASAVKPNTTLAASIPSGPADEFTFLLQRGNVAFARNDDYTKTPPLGTRQTITAQASVVNLRELGRLDFTTFTIKIDPGAQQPESSPVSTGTVNMRVNIPIVSERIGKSNLKVLRAAIRQP